MEGKKNPSLQIEISRTSKESDKRRLNRFCNSCKLKEK
jgi:hypothetical protein